MNTPTEFKASEQRAARWGLCGLGLWLALQAPIGAAAPSTTLSNDPMILVSPTHPQVLLLLNTSQSMDGNLSGAIMTGATGTYTVETGFTAPVDGTTAGNAAAYTVGGKDNSDSRLNVAKASIAQILSTYQASNDFGLMTLGTSGSPGLYNTWVYYMSPQTSNFTFTNTAAANTYPNPCYGVTTGSCPSLASHYGYTTAGFAALQFFIAAGPSNGSSPTPGSSDDPQVNDVLYSSPGLASAFISYGGVSPSTPYPPGFTLAQYNAGTVCEGYLKSIPSYSYGCPGTSGQAWGTSPTNAGYVPYSPEVLYVSRGFGYYNSITNTGKLVMPVTVDSTARETSFAALLAPETNTASSGEIKANAINAATAGMLKSAAQYYAGTYSYGGTNYPAPTSNNGCPANKYVVLITDGLPTWDLEGNAWPPLGSLAGTGYGVTYTVNSDGTITTNDTAVNDATQMITNLYKAGIKTYVIGMGAGVKSTVNPAAASTLTAMAIAGGTNNYFPATSPADVSNDMAAILQQIQASNSTTTSAAVNSTNANITSGVFQASFQPNDVYNDWTGDAKAFPYVVTNNTIVTTTPDWSAQAQLDGLNWYIGNSAYDDTTGRHIVTFNPTLGQGVPFVWSAVAPATAISAAQQSLLQTSTTDTLGPSRLNYLRGDKSLEQSVGTFRKRTHLLGDIANSTPLYVGVPAGPYPDISYQSFEATNSTRDPMLYVGANDGMLHAFCAALTFTTGHCTPGNEMFAFIPNGVFSQLINLTKPTYNSAHQFFVDGSPAAGDVQFTDSSWHTLLIGGLNNGGNSIYAIDVTTPPSGSYTEASIASKVLWEYTDTTLGRTFSRPTTARITLGGVSKFVVIFGSGYNNSNGKPYLYIVDAQTGANVGNSPIDLCGHSATCNINLANGLSNPATLSPDGSGLVTAVYAGDLQGNLWKVDLTAATWAGTLVFKAVDSSGNPQPITTTPTLSLHPDAPTLSGYMVYFGTGQFLGLPDITNTATQSVYGVWDNPSAHTLPLRCTSNSNCTGLISQTLSQTSVTQTLVSGTTGVRLETSNPICWAVSTSPACPTVNQGWYFDLPVAGERVISDTQLYSQVLVLSTFIPFIASASACNGAGTGYNMYVDYTNGGPMPNPEIDLYGNGAFGTVTGSNGNQENPAGILFSNYIAEATRAGNAYLVAQSNQTITVVNTAGGTNGRTSWIQLQ